LRRRRHPKNPLWWAQSARVLDFLPEGRPLDKHPEHRSKPFIQVLEESKLKLLEVSVRFGSNFIIGEKISFKPLDERVLMRAYVIDFNDLTTVARENLSEILKEYVKENEPLFVAFINIAEPITLKLHALELIPGIGKKTLMHILEARKDRPFESFEDFEKRTGFKGIVEALAERILKELQGNEKYYLFVEPPKGSHSAFFNYLAAVRRHAQMDDRRAGEAGSET